VQPALFRNFVSLPVLICAGALAERRQAMAKIIEFYIPKNFRKDAKPAKTRGELIEFHVPKKSA
jgi:hypothetical protein